jgi:penicillin-binding protein 1A
MYEEPRIVTRIVGPDGKDVDLKPPPPPRRVLDPAEAFIVTSMLESVVDHGTGQKAKTLGRRIAGKTGTSNEAKDTWFAGFSPEITTVVWVGYDDNKPLGVGETGGSTALPAFVEMMDAAHKDKPRSEFARPPGIATVAIDPKTGKLKAEGVEADPLDEVFLIGTEPTETSEPARPDAGATTLGSEDRGDETGGIPATRTGDEAPP